MKKKRIVALLCALAMACSLAGCGDTDTGNQTSANDQQPEQTEPKVTDAGTIGDYDVAIKDCAFGTDYEGNKMIVINYDFINNSDEAIAPIWAISEKAFQDGVELEVAMALDNSVYDAGISQKELKPGASMQGCQSAYVLTSESPVEFEITDIIGLSDTTLTKTFEVQ